MKMSEVKTSMIDQAVAMVTPPAAWLCGKSELLKNFIIGDVPATQWRRVSSDVERAGLKAVSEGSPSAGIRPRTFQEARVLQTPRGDLVRQALNYRGKPALAYNIGGIVMAGELPSIADNNDELLQVAYRIGSGAVQANLGVVTADDRRHMRHFIPAEDLTIAGPVLPIVQIRQEFPNAILL